MSSLQHFTSAYAWLVRFERHGRLNNRGSRSVALIWTFGLPVLCQGWLPVWMQYVSNVSMAASSGLHRKAASRLPAMCGEVLDVGACVPGSTSFRETWN